MTDLGFAIVVKEVVLVSLCPLAVVAVTLAVYVFEYFSGAAGTQEEPSSRMAPLTVPTPAAVRLTLVIFPPVILVPISALTGCFFAPLAGVMLKASGSAAGVGVAVAPALVPLPFPNCGFSPPSPPQAARPNGATTASATIIAQLRVFLPIPTSVHSNPGGHRALSPPHF